MSNAKISAQSVKVGASELEIKETGGKFDLSGVQVTNIGNGTAAGQALSYSQIGAANGVAGLDGTGKVPTVNLPSSSAGFGRNMVVNGAFRFNVRGLGVLAPFSPTSTSFVTGNPVIDAMKFFQSVANNFTYEKGNPSGIPGVTNSVLFTVTNAYTPVSNDRFLFAHRFEQASVIALKWGTGSAKTVTLSFHVKSSLTGNFTGSLNGAGRSYNFTYNITAAGVLTRYSITIPGDTSGSWSAAALNELGLTLNLSLGVASGQLGTANTWGAQKFGVTGSVNLVETVGATWEVTGIQLEEGSTLTDLEIVPYGFEAGTISRLVRGFDISVYNLYGHFGTAIGLDATTAICMIPLGGTMRFSTTIGYPVLHNKSNQIASAMYLTLAAYPQDSGTQIPGISILESANYSSPFYLAFKLTVAGGLVANENYLLGSNGFTEPFGITCEP